MIPEPKELSVQQHCACCSHKRGKIDDAPEAPEPGMPKTETAIEAQNGQSADPTCRLLRLPVELRCLIYEHVLVVGKVFFRNSVKPQCIRDDPARNDQQYYEKPTLALLRVCKTIHEEAEPIYLSYNLFVLPLRWQLQTPFKSEDDLKSMNSLRFKDRQLFSVCGLQFVRNISFAIDRRDLATTEELGFNHRDWKFGEYNLYEPGERLRALHEYGLGKLSSDVLSPYVRSWSHIANALEMFAEARDRDSKSMKYVEIDYSNAFCSMGCCRPRYLFEFDWVSDLLVDVFNILGTLDFDTEETGGIILEIEECECCDANYVPLRYSNRLLIGDLDPPMWTRFRISESDNSEDE